MKPFLPEHYCWLEDEDPRVSTFSLDQAQRYAREAESLPEPWEVVLVPIPTTLPCRYLILAVNAYTGEVQDVPGLMQCAHNQAPVEPKKREKAVSRR